MIEAPPPAGMADRLAGELDDVRLEIEAVAMELCRDAVMFERHAVSLQRFDRLAQTVGEVARLLHARHAGEEAVQAIGLEAMRERLEGARW